MDPRLVAPLEPEALVTVAGLATGYGFGASHFAQEFELGALADYRDPVALTTRLTYRVIEAGREKGADPQRIKDQATYLLRGAPLATPTRDHAVEVLEVAVDADQTVPWLADRYLDAFAAEAAGYVWLELIDGACAALRSTIVAVTGQPLGHSSAATVLARGAALTLPR